MSGRCLLLLTLLLTLLSPRPADAQDPAYVAQLHQVLDAVETAGATSGTDRTEATAQALEALRRIETERSDTTPYLAHVEEALTRTPPDLLKARDYLAALIAELDVARVEPGTPAQEQALRLAYEDPRFAQGDSPSWLERALGRFGDWLRRLLRGLPIGSASAGGLTVARLLLVLLCIGLVALVLALVLRSARRIAQSKPSESSGAGRAPASSTSMLAVAAECARAGDLRGAVRAQFVALLLALLEQGKLRYDRSLTNREHLSRLGRDTPLAEALRPVVRVFDDVWYGDAPISPTEYEKYASSTDALRGGVG